MRNTKMQTIDQVVVITDALKALGVNVDQLTIDESLNIRRDLLESIDKHLVKHDPREGARAMMTKSMNGMSVYDVAATQTTIYFDALDNIEIAISDGNIDEAFGIAEKAAYDLFDMGW